MYRNVTLLVAGAGLGREVIEEVVEAVVAGGGRRERVGRELLVEVGAEESGQLGVLVVGGAGGSEEQGHGE